MVYRKGKKYLNIKEAPKVPGGTSRTKSRPSKCPKFYASMILGDFFKRLEFRQNDIFNQIYFNSTVVHTRQVHNKIYLIFTKKYTKNGPKVNKQQNTVWSELQIYASPEKSRPALLPMLETFRRSNQEVTKGAKGT